MRVNKDALFVTNEKGSGQVAALLKEATVHYGCNLDEPYWPITNTDESNSLV